MSLTPEGTYECDRCAVDVGNGSVMNAVVVSDLDPDQPGHVRNLHFCRDRPDGDGVIKGCARKLLSPSIVAAYTDRKERARG